MYIYHYFYTKIYITPVKIGLLHHRGAGDVELWGLYGDAFDPRARNVDFDVVVVSATLNPLAVLQSNQGNVIVWQQNNLLHSALVNTYVDGKAFKRAIEEMVISMGRNGGLVRYFLNPKYKFDKPHLLKDLVHVYYWDVPDDGPFHARTGINAMVAVPIFDPQFMYRNLSSKALLYERLRDNVFIVIKRALELVGDIEDQKAYSVHAIAIPALAGTCCRLDSWLYLDYLTSYFTILDALESTKIPNPIDRIYIIAYDKLAVQENKAALQAMFRIYSYYKLRYWLDSQKFYPQGRTLRSLVWIMPFFLLLVLTHRKWKLLFLPSQRQSFVLKVAGIVSTYYVIAAFINEYLLEHAKGSATSLIIGDIVFGMASILVLSWLNNRWF